MRRQNSIERNRARLALEQLEARAVPAQVGVNDFRISFGQEKRQQVVSKRSIVRGFVHQIHVRRGD
jgi:hypothetical protein